MGISGTADHPPLLGLVGSAGAIGPVALTAAALLAVELAALGAAGPVVSEALGVLRAADDGGHPPLGRQSAFGIQLDTMR